MNEIYEFAHKYRKLGWNVIPLYQYQKAPSISWKPYQERMATDEEFENWFSSELVTGLGLITGKLSGIVVLDEDIYKPGGIKVNVASGMLAQTARGGKHHFFKYVEPIKSSGFREGINVEIKADGGFVVLPPSVVVIEEKECTYKWIEKCMPKDLMEVRESDLAPYRPSAGVSEAIDILSLTRAPLGTQHNNLRSFALAVFNRFSEKEWSIAIDFIRVEAGKFDPPHPSDRVEKLIRDCMEFVKRNPKETVEKEIANTPMTPRTINEIAALRIADRKLEKTAPKTGWPELDDLIKGFIPGHIYTFTGDTNVGKTTIACNFAEALRVQGKHTLYIALEPDVNVVEYMASIRHRKKFDDLTDEDLSVEVEDEYVNIFLHEDVRTVEDLIRALKGIDKRYDLIIIDHIGYFVRSERDWLQQQGNVIKELAFLAKGNKSAVMLIAHLRKPSSTKKDVPPTQNDISGSGAFKQDSTEVLIAFRPTKSEDEFAVEFANYGTMIVTKTKVGPNGSFPIIFSERQAKVWSKREAALTLEGRIMVQEKDEQRFDEVMENSSMFDDEENDS